MSYNLFLDDERFPQSSLSLINKDYELYQNDSNWIIVRTYEEFTEVIMRKGLPDYVSFDHDLADIKYNPMTQQMSFEYREKTGYDCAKWLSNYCLDNNYNLPTYQVHSANPIGAENIRGFLNNFKKHFNYGNIR